MRVQKAYKGNKKELDELFRSLAGVAKQAKRLVLFVASRDDIEVDSVPAYASHIPFRSLDDSLLRRDSKKEEDLYCRWLLGTAISSLSAGSNVLARRGVWSHAAFRQWVLDRGTTSERADFYLAASHLSERSRWQPSKQILTLNRWPMENEKRGETR